MHTAPTRTDSAGARPSVIHGHHPHFRHAARK